jgi:hypothetical protein
LLPEATAEGGEQLNSGAGEQVIRKKLEFRIENLELSTIEDMQEISEFKFQISENPPDEGRSEHHPDGIANDAVNWRIRELGPRQKTKGATIEDLRCASRSRLRGQI